MSDYYKKLFEFSSEIAEKATDYDYNLEFELLPIGNNYPWLYIDFKIHGNLTLSTVNDIKNKFDGFAAMNGGSVETVLVGLRRGDSGNSLLLRVKMVYVEFSLIK